MGRKKIEIKLIEDPKVRTVTFRKRRAGIAKKAHELGTLTGCVVYLFIGPPDDSDSTEDAAAAPLSSKKKKKKETTNTDLSCEASMYWSHEPSVVIETHSKCPVPSENIFVGDEVKRVYSKTPGNGATKKKHDVSVTYPPVDPLRCSGEAELLRTQLNDESCTGSERIKCENCGYGSWCTCLDGESQQCDTDQIMFDPCTIPSCRLDGGGDDDGDSSIHTSPESNVGNNESAPWCKVKEPAQHYAVPWEHSQAEYVDCGQQQYHFHNGFPGYETTENQREDVRGKSLVFSRSTVKDGRLFVVKEENDG